MSHSVTVTRTTTTSTTSALLVNTGFCKTIPGILKLLELVLGAVCVGIVAHYTIGWNHLASDGELFFLLMATTFMIATFAIVISCILSITTATILPKSMFEFVYHGIAFILYLAASITLLVNTSRGSRYYKSNYEPLMAASVIGLVNTALYFLSTIYAYKSYRGG